MTPHLHSTKLCLLDEQLAASPLLPRGRQRARSKRPIAVVRAQVQTLPETTQLLLEAQKAPALKAAADKTEQLKILYDGLVEVHKTIATATGLQVTPTKLSENGQTSYGTEDGSTSIQFLVNKGGKVEWMSSACSVLKAGGGLARVTAFADHDLEAPHLNYELGYVFGSITVYLNLTARVNLLLDDEYFKRYYQRKTKTGLSINDLELQLQKDKAFKPFRSQSADVRMLAGQTALLYTAEGTVENVKKAVEYGRKVTDIWLEFISDPSNRAPEEKRKELEAHDRALYPFARKDPGNAIIVGLLGAEKTEELLKLTCKDPSILA